MIILIAEAKTMRAQCDAVSAATVAAHMPARYAEASEIALCVASMPVEALCQTAKVSVAIGRRMRELAQQFVDTSRGYRAIDGFTGVVFKALAPQTLTAAEQALAQRQVVIASSLYGLLRPDDIIRPYRLEYKMTLPAPIGNLTQHWRALNTADLLARLDADGDREVVDLLPKAASDCFDWRAIKAEAQVYHIDVKEMRSGGAVATPHAEALKEARGLILRQIIQQGITRANEIGNAESDHFAYDADLSTPDTFTFLTARI